jgi:hypothetical protein
MRVRFRNAGLSLAVVTLLLLCSNASPSLSQSSGQGQNAGQSAGQIAGKISALIPVDFVLRGGQTFDAAKEMGVFWGDVVKTERGGRVRVRLEDSSILNIGSESSLTVTSHEAALQRTRVELFYGRMRAHVAKMTKNPTDFIVRTPVAVAGVVGTEFFVEASASQTTVVALDGGQVKVQSLDPRFPDAVLLDPGETTSVVAGERPTPKRLATIEELTRAVAETAADELDGLANRVLTNGKGLVRLADGVRLDAELTKSLDAKTAKVGDVVEAKVTDNVKADGTVLIPRGTKLLGHVTSVQAKTKTQTESKLGIELERAVLKNGREIPLLVAIQAVADRRAMALAASQTDHDWVNPAQPTPRQRTQSAGLGATSAVRSATTSVSQTTQATSRSTTDTTRSVTRTAPASSSTTTTATSSTGITATGDAIRVASDSQAVVGMPGVNISAESSLSAGGSVLTSRSRNVRLDSGTRLTLRVLARAN